MKEIKFLLLFGVLTLTLSYTASAQLKASEDTSKGGYGGVLNAFVNFGNDTAIKAHYEIGLWKNITISPTMRIQFGDNSYFGLGARGDYYFDSLLKLSEPWDIYAGVDMISKSGSSDFHLNGHMGAEYIFGFIGVVAEFGFLDVTSGSIGVALHF